MAERDFERIQRRAHEIWEREGRREGRDREHWAEAERQIALETGQEPGQRADRGADANEGEGSRSAARDYNRRTQRFIGTGKVEEKAREAARAVEGEEGETLREAEQAGKSHSHGEDPELAETAQAPAERRGRT